MRLIIDIPKEKYEMFLNDGYAGLLDNDLYYDIKNGTPIPDNATNGDVLMAMFPNIDFTEMAITVHATTKVTSNGVKGSISYDFWKDWWNAPYQKGNSK